MLSHHFISLFLQFFIRRDEQCNVVCKIDKLPKHDAAVFKDKIEDEYRVNM
jgi:hypothetical protein